jgi:hypothetical protein
VNATHDIPVDSIPERCPPASPEEIQHAEALRRAIHQRYLAAANRQSDPYWSVGAD